jgi:uncharacterized protein (TIGR03437 family)
MKLTRLLPLFVVILAQAQTQTSYPYAISTVAGAYQLGNGGLATAALLDLPWAAVVDKTGNIWIADGVGHGIREVTPDGKINSFSTFDAVDLKLDASGNLYAVDGVGGAFKISPTGAVTQIAGGTTQGLSGTATSIALAYPSGIAVDSSSNVYIADTDHCVIRKVTPAGNLTTIAGTGICGFAGDGGQATQAWLYYPMSLVVDSSGTIYEGEQYGVRKIQNGVISTVVGLGTTVVDGPAAQSAVGSVVGLALDSAGNLYVADGDNNRVRVVTSTSNGLNIKTIAGTGAIGSTGDGGPALSALLFDPNNVSFDASGNLYIVDQGNSRIRKYDTRNNISTVAGALHFSGDNGAAANAQLHLPGHVISDAAGNVYVSDSYNNRIRKIGTDGTITTIAGSGPCTYTGDGGKATSATLCVPQELVLDGSGNLYIADQYNYVVRKLNLTSGVISTYAGNGTFGDNGDNGAATSAQMGLIVGIALDSKGNLYISDNYNNRIRKVTAGTGTITSYAGTEQLGFSGDGGLATAAKLAFPGQLATDSSDNLFIIDQLNNRIRKVSSGGIITTVAGVGTCCGTGANATNTYIDQAAGIATDAAGNLYVSTPFLEQILKITPAGVLTAVAGNGTGGYAGDGGIALQAEILNPAGLSVTSAGDLYFADEYNSRIRKLTLDTPTQIVATGGDGQSGVAGTSLAIPLTVQVSFRAGVGVAGLPITFAITSGTATLSATSSNTDATGTAGVALTLTAVGPVTVTATLAGLPPVTFHLTGTSSTPTTPLPTISSGGITGGGGSVPAITSLSPGGLATIYGSNLAPAGTAYAVQSSDLVNGVLPTSLIGTCVTVGGISAFLTFVSPGQVNFQVPNVPVNTTLPVQVTTACGTSAALQGPAVTAATLAATPEFLYWVKNASGKNPIIAVNSVTGAYAGASGLISGLTFTPAKPGDYLTIYAISFGATSPAVAAGVAPPAIAAVSNTPVGVTLGSTSLPAANILYAGVSPGIAGLYQLNIQVPAMPDGDYPIVLTMGSFSTAAGPYLTIHN